MRARDARGALSAVQRARGGGPCACGGCTRSNMRQEEPDRSARSGVMMLELPFWPWPSSVGAAGRRAVAEQQARSSMRCVRQRDARCRARSRQRERVRSTGSASASASERSMWSASSAMSCSSARTLRTFARRHARPDEPALERGLFLPDHIHPPTQPQHTSSTHTLGPPCRLLAPSAPPCARRLAPSPPPCPWLARTPLRRPVL